MKPHTDNSQSGRLSPSHGRVLRQVAANEYRFTLARYPAWGRLESHVHEHPGIVLVVEGGLEEAFSSSSLNCPQGSLVVRRHDHHHADHFGPGGATLLVIEHIQKSFELAAVPSIPAVIDTPYAKMLGAALHDEIATGCAAIDIALFSHATDLWDAATAPRRHCKGPRVERAIERIHSDIGSIRRIELLARDVDANPIALARGFRARFGCSLGTYVLRVRTERAHHLLRHTRESFSSIAARVGFSDQSHMTRSVRMRYGRLPSAIRTER